MMVPMVAIDGSSHGVTAQTSTKFFVITPDVAVAAGPVVAVAAGVAVAVAAVPGVSVAVVPGVLVACVPVVALACAVAVGLLAVENGFPSATTPVNAATNSRITTNCPMMTFLVKEDRPPTPCGGIPAGGNPADGGGVGCVSAGKFGPERLPVGGKDGGDTGTVGPG